MLLPLLGACQTDGAGAGASLLSGEATPGTAWSGDRSQSGERAYVLADTPREWTELWARVGAPAPGPLPDGRMAAAVFLGPRDTAGFGVVIEDARAEGDTLVIGYHERVPGPDEAVAQVTTSPYAVRLLPRVAGTPKFVREK